MPLDPCFAAKKTLFWRISHISYLLLLGIIARVLSKRGVRANEPQSIRPHNSHELLSISIRDTLHPARDSSVSEQHIQPSMSIEDLIYKPADSSLIGYIERHDPYFGARIQCFQFGSQSREVRCFVVN